MAQAEAATANYLMQRLYTDWVVEKPQTRLMQERAAIGW